MAKKAAVAKAPKIKAEKQPKIKDQRNSLELTGFQKFIKDFARNWQLHLMIFLPIAYMAIFHYLPMTGLQMAFRDFTPASSVDNSEWLGLGNFVDFFTKNYRAVELIMNTLILSLYTIAVGFPIPIILALIIHVNTIKPLKKLSQNISYVPHFISVVIMIGILRSVLDPYSGILGSISRHFNMDYFPDLWADEKAFRHLYVWSGVWQSMGWSSIIYVSALAAVPDDLHEAAKLDGASRLRRVWSVDLPTILPTIAIMLIMRFGSIMSVGYQKAFLMQNTANSRTSEIISTYVYKQGFTGLSFGYSTAVGLMNSVVNTSMVVLVNWVTNRLTDNEMGLF